MKKEILGPLFGILAAFSYAVMAVFVKLTEGVPLLTLVFFRNLVSLIVLMPFLLRKGFKVQSKRNTLHIVRAVTGLLAIYGYFYTVQTLPLVNALLFSNAIPLFIPLVVLFWLKVKVPTRRVLALMLGFFGIVWILRPSLDFPVYPSLVGIIAAGFGAVALVSVRQLSKTEATETILFYFFTYSLILSFFPMLVFWSPIEKMQTWIYVVLVGVSATSYQWCLTKAYTYIHATKAGCVMYFSVVFAGLFGWLIWQDIPETSVIFGAILVIIGGALVLLDKQEPIRLSKKPKKRF